MGWPADNSGGAPAPGTPTVVVQNVRTVAVSGNVLSSDATIRINGASITLTLPPAASVTGQRFTFKKISADEVADTIKCSGAETIDGDGLVQVMSQYEAVAMQSNGTSYDVLYRG